MADVGSVIANARVSDPTRLPLELAQTQGAVPRGRLLLVDDDEIFVTRLARAMEKRGFVPRTAVSVADALAMIRQAPPAYAVIDLRLEDGNGLDVVEALRDLREDASRATYEVLAVVPGEQGTA